VGDIGTVIYLDTNDTFSNDTTTVILSCSGVYKVQAYVVMPGWSGLGETAEFTVHKIFE
jgi:hypothetical protein